jgi:hypothetical protein
MGGDQPRPIGLLSADLIRDLANRVKVRALSSQQVVAVFEDCGHVYAVPVAHRHADHIPNDCEDLIGMFDRRATIAEIADALLAALAQLQQEAA